MPQRSRHPAAWRRSPLAAGLAGVAAITPLAEAARTLRLGPDLPRLLGTLVAPPGCGARALGGAAYAASGPVFALGYAGALRALGLRPGPSTGAALGLGHWALSGLTLGALSVLHPRRRQPLPGAFARRYGPVGVVGTLAGHLLFGAVVGALLRPRLPSRPDHLWLPGAPPREAALPQAPTPPAPSHGGASG